jgi:hypothetical protein
MGCVFLVLGVVISLPAMILLERDWHEVDRRRSRVTSCDIKMASDHPRGPERYVYGIHI